MLGATWEVCRYIAFYSQRSDQSQLLRKERRLTFQKPGFALATFQSHQVRVTNRGFWYIEQANPGQSKSWLFSFESHLLRKQRCVPS
jgi:hypothetical protein